MREIVSYILKQMSVKKSKLNVTGYAHRRQP